MPMAMPRRWSRAIRAVAVSEHLAVAVGAIRPGLHHLYASVQVTQPHVLARSVAPLFRLAAPGLRHDERVLHQKMIEACRQEAAFGFDGCRQKGDPFPGIAVVKLSGVPVHVLRHASQPAPLVRRERLVSIDQGMA